MSGPSVTVFLVWGLVLPTRMLLTRMSKGPNIVIWVGWLISAASFGIFQFYPEKRPHELLCVMAMLPAVIFTWLLGGRTKLNLTLHFLGASMCVWLGWQELRETLPLDAIGVRWESHEELGFNEWSVSAEVNVAEFKAFVREHDLEWSSNAQIELPEFRQPDWWRNPVSKGRWANEIFTKDDAARSPRCITWATYLGGRLFAHRECSYR